MRTGTSRLRRSLAKHDNVVNRQDKGGPAAATMRREGAIRPFASMRFDA
jgi:hypothetical protein